MPVLHDQARFRREAQMSQTARFANERRNDGLFNGPDLGVDAPVSDPWVVRPISNKGLIPHRIASSERARISALNANGR